MVAGRGRRRLTFTRLGAFLAVLLTTAGCTDLVPAAPGACQLDVVATLPLARSSHVVIDGRLNRQPARYILDTGAETSHVTPWAVPQYGLARSRSGPTRIIGVGGTILAENVVATIELGGVETRKLVSVVGLPLLSVEGPPLAGLVGADLLSTYDIEVSVPEHLVRLWEPGTAAATMRRGPARTGPCRCAVPRAGGSR